MQGLTVIVDDRKGVSPGVKFKDSELIGVPMILVIGLRLADKGRAPLGSPSTAPWSLTAEVTHERGRSGGAGGPARAVIFDRGGTMTPWHKVDVTSKWRVYARTVHGLAVDDGEALELAGDLLGLDEEGAALADVHIVAAGKDETLFVKAEEIARELEVQGLTVIDGQPVHRARVDAPLLRHVHLVPGGQRAAPVEDHRLDGSSGAVTSARPRR